MTTAPCVASSSTGSIGDLLQRYLSSKCYPRVVPLSSNIMVSSIKNINLKDCIIACRAVCTDKHEPDCMECDSLVEIAQSIINNGYIIMSEAFRKSFPGIKYSAEIARRKLFQLPLVSITVGDPSSGESCCYLLENRPGTDYNAIHQILSAQKKTSKEPGITKEALRDIMLLAQSDREKELIRYTAFVSGRFSQKSARKKLGLDDMNCRTAEVERCIKESKEIVEVIDKMAMDEIRSLAVNHGLSDCEDECYSGSDIELPNETLTEEVKLTLIQLLQDCKHNWFEFISQIESQEELHKLCLGSNILPNFYRDLSSYGLSVKEVELTQQSYMAFKCDEEQHSYNRGRIARILNGDIVSDSESDSESVLCFKDKELAVKRKVEGLKRSARRQKAKRIADRYFLKRSYSKRTDTILDKYPDIGKSIEEYVQSCNVGADRWRRTGVLTFDGNVRVKQKATYQRIQRHLEEKYGQKFSYGTVIELCVARNKRRKSSQRYKGAARVTSRRARKGFTLRYNPDTHWSSALYRGFNALQFADGKNILNINRDDASGFRLDTLFTHKQYSSLTVKGKEVLGTRTDYVNKYKSMLQTTNYNFSGTKTTGELCAGVVKAHGIYPKNPAQHAADLKMLLNKDELRPVFVNSDTDLPKPITCVRVDGASDEGPSHLEVQFWWTEYHLSQGNYMTLLTSRSSGSSYLNRVELQNGCLAQAHSNVFIPSTLKGSCFNSDKGTIDQDLLKENLELATDVYINRCNQCPCGETVINLYRGADSSKWQELRPLLIVFLKGKQQRVAELKQQHPEEFSFLTSVWSIRNRHMVPGLPEQYMFLLRCCLQPDCIHPFCLKAQDNPDCIPRVWYPLGPSIKYLPIPVPDPERHWGRSNCLECCGLCNGHYMKPENLATADDEGTAGEAPPSAIIREFFFKKSPMDCDITELAKRVLLPICEIEIWLEHLKEVQHNRKRGAAQAAITRKANRAARCGSLPPPTDVPEPESSPSTSRDDGCTTTFVHQTDEDYYCGVCGGQFEQETEQVEKWIACDECDSWSHWTCVGITEEPEEFFCLSCSA